MSMLKKMTAVLSAAMVSATLFGCADTSYILKADNDEVKAGVYISYISTELQNHIYSLQNSGVTSDFLNQKVEDKNLKDLVAEEAMTSVKEYAAINAQFDEFGLKLDEDTVKDINSNIADTWSEYQKSYEKQGISKESLKNVSRSTAKRQAIFDYFYNKENGKEAVSDKDMTKYVNDNYLRYKILAIQKKKASTTDSSSADESSQVEDNSKELYEKYLKKAKATDFAGFDKVIDEYTKETTPESSSEAESSVPTDDTSAVDSATDSAVESDSSVADSQSDASSEEESSKDPYANEQMSNYGAMEDKDADSTSVKVLKKIDGMKVGAVAGYEDEDGYYIFIKGDVTERTPKYIADEQQYSTLINEMKGDEFQKKIDSWVEKIKYDINNEAMDRYTVEEVYNKIYESDDSK